MTSQQQRLEIEKQQLLDLASNNSSIQIENDSSAPREFKITFTVQSLADFESASSEWVKAEFQEIELVLPISFPEDPPEMRWLSPIFHPNVSLSGYLDCADIGLEWSADMSLLVICERLWDISRFAWVDIDAANNYAAKRRWSEGEFEVPTDPRPLADDVSIKLANVISYQATNPSAPRPRPRVKSDSVFSIQDSTIPTEQESSTVSEERETAVEMEGPILLDDDSTSSEVIDPQIVEVIESGSLPEVDSRDSRKTDSNREPASDVFVIDDSGSQTPPVIRKDDDDILIIE